MSKQTQKSQVEKETTESKQGGIDTTVTRVGYKKDNKPLPTKEELSKDRLRQYLKASVLQTDGKGKRLLDENGNHIFKKWQPDTPYVKFRKTFMRRHNLPLRLNVGLVTGVLAVVFFAVSLLVFGIGWISGIVALTSLLFAGVASSLLIRRWEREVPNPSAGELDIAAQFHGIGLLSGLAISGAVLLICCLLMTS